MPIPGVGYGLSPAEPNVKDLLWDNHDQLFAKVPEDWNTPLFHLNNLWSELIKNDPAVQQVIVTYASRIPPSNTCPCSIPLDIQLCVVCNGNLVISALGPPSDFANDGIVPVSSADFASTIPFADQRRVFDYNHFELANGKGDPNDPLFGMIENDLSKIPSPIGATPSITSIAPASYPASNSDQLMTVYGNNFQNGASLTFIDPEGTPFPSKQSKLSFVSDTELQYGFNDGSDAGPWSVTVSNPDQQTSNSLTFTVNTPNPAISFDPGTVIFAPEPVGVAGAPQTVIVSNPGAANLSITGLSISGGSAGDFGETNNCTGATLAQSQSCNVSVTFQPTTGGSRVATLLFSDNATGSPQSVVLSGTGVASQPRPGVATNSADLIIQNAARLNSAVNPNGSQTTVYFNYGQTTTYGSSTGTIGPFAGGTTTIYPATSIAGLTCGTTYHFDVCATNASGTACDGDQSFTTLACSQPAAGVNTKPTDLVTQNSAKLSGDVNPNGSQTTVYFNYGQTTAYGTTTSTIGPFAGGTTTITVSTSVSGLACNTGYHFEVCATNGGGTLCDDDESFTTPPCTATVVTYPASSITENGVQLNGTVNPNGSQATVNFYYGHTMNYGTTTGTVATLSPGNNTVSVSYSLTGLACNSEYHFEICANAGGMLSCDSDQSFTTGACPQLSFVPPSLDFGSQDVGSPTAPVSVVVNSSGNADVHVAGVALGGRGPLRLFYQRRLHRRSSRPRGKLLHVGGVSAASGRRE